MIDTFGIIDILYQVLRGSQLFTDVEGVEPSEGIEGVEAFTAMNGAIYKVRRPDNSNKEDCVINCLPVSTDQLQRATANVNIYVPDISISLGGKPQYQPAFMRLQELSHIAISILCEMNEEQYLYEISYQGLLKEESINQHFINLRIEFTNINL